MLVHHELCFGCGRANLFGLLLEAEASDRGSVTARCFIKQDHQGPDRGLAHVGVITTALSEAMALACGLDARVRAVEVELLGSVAVGAFLEIEARLEGGVAESMDASARATAEGRAVARARGRYAAAGGDA